MKAMSAVMAFVAGEAMNVSQVCRECGIAPKTFYKYVARCRVEGLAGRVAGLAGRVAGRAAGRGAGFDGRAEGRVAGLLGRVAGLALCLGLGRALAPLMRPPPPRPFMPPPIGLRACAAPS